MNITVHRGSNQIGGNIIEISTATTCILLDAGTELEGMPNAMPAIGGLFDRAGFDAIFFSHYHLDHVGLADHIHHEIPLYIGEKSDAIIRAAAKYKGETVRDFLHFKSDERLCIGDIAVTPYLVDHSAFDSHMFLVEADGESLLYSGDFRSNGRKSFTKMLSKLPTAVDTLICEGTTLGRDGKSNDTEQELEERLVEQFRATNGPVFILQSAMNIDRLVTMYRAAKRTGRGFLQELYTAEIATAAGGAIPNPVEFYDVNVFIVGSYASDHHRYISFNKYGRKKIGKLQIVKSHFVMGVRSSMGRYLQSLSQQMSFDGGLLVYSMWRGYETQPTMQEFLALCTSLGLKIICQHASGHADEAAIDALIDHVSPCKILPIHTEKAAWFETHYPIQTVSM